jgi:biotin operon repressor
MVEYGTGSLTKEIHRLRSAGVEINTVRKIHPITGKTYARYVLN